LCAVLVVLRKRHKTKDKKIERLTKKIEHTKTAGPSELTPRKQTDIEIEQLNLTPNRKRFVRRKLLLSNSLNDRRLNPVLRLKLFKHRYFLVIPPDTILCSTCRFFADCNFLHNKYKSENLTINVSLTTFGRLRPKHVLLAAFISRNTCQCIHHQNMALRVQAVKKCGVKINENPENLILHIDDMNTLLSSLPEKVFVSHLMIYTKSFPRSPSGQ
jgi:hypothetical protein